MRAAEVFLFCWVWVLLGGDGDCKGLREEFTWTRINYTLPKEAATKILQKDNQTNSDYIYENNVPMGANIWKDKLFVAVPRRRPGIPSTLNYICLKTKRSNRHNVPLTPYPDYLTNTLETDQKREHNFVSVYRVNVDPCDRLWFVDTGLIDVLGTETKIKPKTLYIIDLNTNKIIRSHVFKDSVLKPTSALVNLEIDVEPDKCDEAFAYIPDLLGYGLVVYSYKQNDSWRVDHDYFKYENGAKEYNIGGYSFEWEDGVFSVALTKKLADGYKDAYFHPMSGTRLYKISTRVLKNQALATRSELGDDIKVVGDRGKRSHTSASKLHQATGVLFLGLVNQNALGCWNTNNKEFRASDFDIVHKDDEKMIYPSDVKIYKDDVIVLTNRMPVFLYGKLNYDDVNFRVWVQTVNDAVKETRCETKHLH